MTAVLSSLGAMFLSPWINMLLLGAAGVEVSYLKVMFLSWVIISLIASGVQFGMRAFASEGE
jgi:predicted Na+-dependent transporter